MLKQVAKGRVESFWMVVQDLDDSLYPIFREKGSASLRLDISEAVDDGQGVRGRVEKVPKVVVIDMPPGSVLWSVLPL